MLPMTYLLVAAWSPTASHWGARHQMSSSVNRVAVPLKMNFFNQAKEALAYKAKHVGTMCTVQHVVVGSFEELNKMEAEVKAAGSTFEAMAECARRESLDKSSADKDGIVGPFMLGQKEFAFEKVCFEGSKDELLPCKSSKGFHLIKVIKRGVSGPDGKIIEDR